MTTDQKTHIASLTAVVVHLSGAIGMIASGYADWFVSMTPYNLLFMLALVIWTNEEDNRPFYIFLFLSAAVGIVTEMVGVNTALLFGTYQYGSTLGPGWLGVPFLIGVNWFLVVWSAAQCMLLLHSKLARTPLWATAIAEKWMGWSLVVDAALLATAFDWLLEPVAIKLGYWSWANGTIPFFNYVCWFGISCILLLVFRNLGFRRVNQFAVHLLIIQSLFFFALRIFYQP
jgi:putative membrane protein